MPPRAVAADCNPIRQEFYSSNLSGRAAADRRRGRVDDPAREPRDRFGTAVLKVAVVERVFQRPRRVTTTAPGGLRQPPRRNNRMRWGAIARPYVVQHTSVASYALRDSQAMPLWSLSRPSR